MALDQLGGAYTNETLLASGAKTVSANTAANTGFGGVKDLIVQVAVTAASGTLPTLDVKIQDTVDGGTNWNDIAGLTFTQLITTGQEIKIPTRIFSDSLRVSYTIAGTNPSFTFSVKAFARSK